MDWTQSGSLPYSIASQVSFVFQDKLFNLNGATTSVVQDSWFSYVNLDGLLSGWIKIVSPDKPTYWAFGAQRQNSLYLLGGSTFPPQSSTSDTWYSEINVNGTLKDWIPLIPLKKRLAQGSSIIVGNFIYLVGGFTDSETDPNYSSYYARINEDGSLQEWKETTPTAVPAYGFTLLSDGDYLYAIGLPLTQNTYRILVKLDGTLGDWEIQPALPRVAWRASVVKIGKKAITVGGYDSRYGIYDKIFTSDINSDGNLSEWSESTSSFPRKHCCAPAIVMDGRMYVIGGVDGMNYVSDVWMSDQVETSPVPTPQLKQHPRYIQPLFLLQQ